MSDNVSVDGFKNNKPGRGHGHVVDHGRGCGGGWGGHHPRSKSDFWNPSLDRQGKLTLVQHTHKDSVLHMAKTATTVARLTISHSTAIQSNDLLHCDIEGMDKGFDTTPTSLPLLCHHLITFITLET